MASEVRMPQLGESITEGTISRWLKRPGERIEKYEPLLEVLTDKVDSEVPAPVAGILAAILIGEGETVPVGTLLARIDNQEPAVGAAQAVPAPRRPVVSPLVARMVAEHGLDLGQIPGTGLGGRVSKQDVLRYLGLRDEARATGVVAVQEGEVQPAIGLAGRQLLNPVEAGLAPEPVAEAKDIEPAAERAAESQDVEVLPLTALRRSIAEHVQRSVQTAPHVTSVFEVDMSGVQAHRLANQEAFARQGLRLTYTPYLIEAAAAALRAVPLVNGCYSDAGIVLNRRVHIGVAVALAEGLIVPVVRDADEKTLPGLVRTLNDLVQRARTRRLLPEETKGGTFSISNHGVGGSLLGTPIINQPQSAILGVGAIVKRPVVVSYAGQDSIAIRPMCYLALTFDHRLIDGAIADAFLATIKKKLEMNNR